MSSHVLEGTVFDNPEHKGGRLSGVAVDLRSSEPKTNMSTRTNLQGEFRFTRLPPDTYTLVFSREGFQREVVRVALGSTEFATKIATHMLRTHPPKIER